MCDLKHKMNFAYNRKIPSAPAARINFQIPAWNRFLNYYIIKYKSTETSLNEKFLLLIAAKIIRFFFNRLPFKRYTDF